MAHTLLLADDSVTIQRVIELTFADEDVHVVAVSNGDEAIKVLDKTPPDIVLADVGMPGRSGYEVAEHVRKSPHLAHIPVVLLTGAFEKIDEKKAANCDGVLNKPFEPQLVIGRVRELLAKGRKAASPVGAPPSAPVGPVRQYGTVTTEAPPPAAKPSVDNRDYFDKLDRAFAKLSTESGGAPRSIADAIDWFATHPEGGQPPATAAVPDRFDAVPPPAQPAGDLPLSYPAPSPASVSRPAPSNRAAVPDAAPAKSAQSLAFDSAQVRAFDSAPAKAVESAPAKPTDSAHVRPVDSGHAKPVEPGHAKPVEPGHAKPVDSGHARAVDSAQTKPPAPAPAAQFSKPATPPTLPPLADAFAALLAAEQSSPAPSGAPIWPAAPPAPVAVTEELIEQVTRRVLERLSDRVMREAIGEKVAGVAERLVREEIDRIKSSIK